MNHLILLDVLIYQEVQLVLFKCLHVSPILAIVLFCSLIIVTQRYHFVCYLDLDLLFRLLVALFIESQSFNDWKVGLVAHFLVCYILHRFDRILLLSELAMDRFLIWLLAKVRERWTQVCGHLLLHQLLPGWIKRLMLLHYISWCFDHIKVHIHQFSLVSKYHRTRSYYHRRLDCLYLSKFLRFLNFWNSSLQFIILLTRRQIRCSIPWL